ncbi:MAG: DUF3015 domain-containing protein [Hahellaceae bacterium]|nr:DUF3015 domain-containing protein [Hahellaceae bacterium]
MKKFWLAAVVSAAMVQPAFAENGSGCGLGSTIFKGQSGLVPHVLAATTNGTSGNQTFGMTTGTLGCNVNAPITLIVSMYVDQNMEQLARDMSRGQGEHLDALATVLKIEAADRPAFNNAVQTHFDSIFTNENVTSSEVIEKLAVVMQNDPTLIKYLG